jgi:hypothetical protein
MKRAPLRFIGTSRSILLFAFILIAVLVAIGLWAFRALTPPPPFVPVLTGTYRADDGGIYYVQRSSNTLWWAGMSLDKEPSAEVQWHRGLDFTNVFRGTINSDNTVSGEWSDVPRGASLDGGTLSIRFSNSGGVTQFTRIAATGNFRATTWHKSDALDDLRFNGATMDIIARFDQVHKNTDHETIHDNLKPYRDQTVFYGRLITSHLEYLNDNCVELEIPHVNYGPDFVPVIFQGNFGQCGHESPRFLNFGGRGREYDDFVCFHAGDGDADFDMRLKVDLNKLESDFYTTGWGDRTSGPAVFSLKLNDQTTQEKLGFAANEAYMGLEALMYGRPGICDGDHASPINGGPSMLPGWADLSSNSVLINGRPINGLLREPNAPCDFLQPCPVLIRYNGRNLFDIPGGIQLGNLLLSAHGNGQIDANGNVGDGPGTYIRVTGALVLDCGHHLHWWDPDLPCFDDDPTGDPDDIKSHSNQEIHPIYSIDVINYPYRPEDINVQGQTDLTGTYGGSDGSTYYVRQTGSTNIHQLGRTIWWLGLMRDRQPTQRGTHFPIIGFEQLEPVFDFLNPPCPASNQCWAFANVFKGAITESPGQTLIEGDWVGVPQSTSAGSSGGHQTFSVRNHKIITTYGLPPVTIFPVTIEKLYDVLNQTGSAGNLP